MKKILFTIFPFVLVGLFANFASATSKKSGKAFFRDLSPMIGEGQINALGYKGECFTGFLGESKGGGGFLWTKKDGCQKLPIPKDTENCRGISINDDGTVVAGMCDSTLGNTTQGDRAAAFTLWVQDKKATSYGFWGPNIAGVSGDGSKVAFYTTLGFEKPNSAELDGLYDKIFMDVANEEFYTVESKKYPGKLLVLGADGDTTLIGGSKFNGKYLIRDSEPDKQLHYNTEGLPKEFPFNMLPHKSKKTKWEISDISVHTINYDGSFAAGELTVAFPYSWDSDEHFSFLVYWDKNGKIHFLEKTYQDKFSLVSAISDDGNTILIEHDRGQISVWRRGKGVKSLKDIFKEYKIDVGTADANHMRYPKMSRDGSCITAEIYHGENEKGRAIFNPFMFCFSI